MSNILFLHPGICVLGYQKAEVEIAFVERRFVWAYISEIPPLQKIEYGHQLPQPGREDRWLDSLPRADRNYLLRRR